MRHIAALAVLLLGLAGAAWAASPSATPAGTLKLQTAYYNAGNWEGYWSTLSPRVRSYYNKAACIAQLKEQRGSQNPHDGVTAIKVRTTSPTRAVLSYVVVQKIGSREHIAGDVYVKVGGRWYDHLDAIGNCGH